MKRLWQLGSRISIRLLAFNLLLVFLPAAGLLFLDVHERQLLDAQERLLVQQGRVLAAALSERGVLKPAYAEGILVRLKQRSEARMRVVDHDGKILADSATLGPQKEPEPGSDAADSKLRAAPLYRLGSWFFRWYQKLFEPAPPLVDPEWEDSVAPVQLLTSPEIREALSGRYGARTRISPFGQRSVTLYSALPIWDGDQVVGAVQVSQSTYRLLRALYEIRLGVFRVFVASVGVAVVLSLLVSTTIARPLHRLRDEANALLDRRGRIRGRFRGNKRTDEIGELSRALEELSRRLEEHVSFIEAFAADLSHEVKNPLASIRSATEMAREVAAPAERQRFLGIVEREVARMEHLLARARELAQVDARLETEGRQRVELNEILPAIVEGYRLRGQDSVRFETSLGTGPLSVRASAERLTQVLENVLDNAVSFSPRGGVVRLEAARREKSAEIAILDEGPGIPAGSEELIFSRFYTYRPGKPKLEDGHTGLGLSLVKAIVEGYGGTVTASNRTAGGASFVVRLPLS